VSESRILELIDRYAGWAINVLKDMISIPTVNPPGDKYGDFTSYSKELLSSLGMDVKVYEVPRDYVRRFYPDFIEYPRYVVISRVGDGEPVVHFNGHYDVVPAGSGWSKDPFNPVIEGGKVFGRGSVDMKGGIVASVLAIRAFTEAVPKFRGSVEIALVPDEEIGGETGTGYLINEGLSRPNYVLIGEPSSSTNVWIGHKGALWAYVEVYGKQAHGSTPWYGVNAFEYMAKIVNKFMDEYVKSLETRRSSYVYDDPRGAKPTATLGGEVRGGAKVNVVPGYYAFSIDRRIIPEERVEDVEGELIEFVGRVGREFPEVRVNVKVVSKSPPALTDPNSTLVRLVSEVITKVKGSKPNITVCLGGLDMRYYTVKGVEAVAYGPGPLENAHIADEYVSVDEVINVAKVYALTIYQLLCGSSSKSR